MRDSASGTLFVEPGIQTACRAKFHRNCRTDNNSISVKIRGSWARSVVMTCAHEALSV